MAPPSDPRSDRDVPALGSLAVVTRLDDLVTRVIAPNGSKMTLDGTNTYIVGNPSLDVCVVIDPGPQDKDHLDRVELVIREMDAEVAIVLVTHHHRDHSAAAQFWAAKWGCKVAAQSPNVAGAGGVTLDHDSQILRFSSFEIEVVPTPGHCSDHLAFRLENGVVFTGDHILGRGTSVVTWPEGNLMTYLESLHKILNLNPGALYPGHGPEMTGQIPGEVISYYLAQRAFRRAQIIDFLNSEPRSLEELVELIYGRLPTELNTASRMSTQACLDMLQMENRVAEISDGRWSRS